MAELTPEVATELADDIGGIPDDLQHAQAEVDALAMYSEGEGPRPSPEQVKRLIRFLRSAGMTAIGAAQTLEDCF